MRRNAFTLTLPAYAILLVLVLLSAVGKAEERHDVATAAAQKPPVLLATEAVETPAEELLHDIGLSVVAPKPRTMTMEVTAYCPCKKCCGKQAQGVTASGLKVSYNRGRFVAADTAVLSFHQKLSIPGYAGGAPVPVIDRGGAIKGNRLDVFFPTHEQALQWGRRTVEVVVIE